MLLALPVLLGLLIGKLTGGSFQRLSSAPIRAPWLFLLGLGVQLVLYTPLTDRQAWDISYGRMVYVASLLLLLAGLAVNIGRLRWPIILLTGGATLNVIVIVINGGSMPVDATLLAQARGHHLVSLIAHHKLASNVARANAHTRLAFLDDHITLPLPLVSSVYSLGDMLIGLGGFLLVISEMRRGCTKQADQPSRIPVRTESLSNT